jgi:hypothetical protein
VDQSDNLKDILFSCKVEDKTDRQSLTQDQRDEYQCPGEKAYKMLTEIARGARNARPEPKSLKTEADSGKDVRIQVTYRDTNNSIYYIPIHLLRVEKGKDDLLADAVRIEQPLPIMFRTSTEERCVSQWVAGLVLKEPYYDEKGWRNNWLHKFGEMKNYSFWPIVNMQDLRNTYFLNRPGIPKNIRSGMPEGLVLLSHYGEGYITDQENFYSSNRVGPDDVQRVFGGFSLAVIAACSVGGLGGPDRENTLFIHKLNENNVRAAIISPFKIPPPAATRFLDALRTIMSNLTTSRSLYDVFMDTRAEYRKANTAEGHLIPWVNLFMLIGDGDVKICKSNK